MDLPDPQADVFALLADPATHGGHAVRRIDTHAASVFLAGRRALKVKRAVRFPFLDYGTLERRKAACEAELEVNRRLAPSLYLRAIPITREADGRLALDGSGVPVEWAVEMNRFDEDKTLDHVADAGALTTELAATLGGVVAAAHADAPAVEAAPWVDALAIFIDQNDAELRQYPDLFAAPQVDVLSAASRRALARVRDVLLARGHAGFVRRVHGDLHLGNIALVDGAPMLFDAIEFDPVIGSGDVLYDLAFLLMDLLERGLSAAANAALNSYLAHDRQGESLDALCALPLFMALRAAIRAKVTAARLAGAADRDAVARQAATYFRLAQRLIAPPPARLIAVGGLSGSGKSVLARALAPDVPPPPGAVLLRSDVERKALYGVAETDPLPAEAYAPAVGHRVYETLGEKARRVLAAGHSAIVDAVFARPEERAAITVVASAAGSSFAGLFLTADLATRAARVNARRHDASDADAAIARQQESYDLGTMDWIEVDATGTPAETLSRALAALKASATRDT